VRRVQIIQLKQIIIYRKISNLINHLPGCVAGSRFPINNFVFTTLVGPLIVIVCIWNYEEKKRKETVQLNFSLTKQSNSIYRSKKKVKLKKTKQI
jgi:hypothetical protein